MSDRWHLWLLPIGAVVVLLGTSSCERKAPGPFDCEAAGARALGITHRSQLQDPRVKQALDTWTVECLTTPFDRQLLRCVEETGRAQMCLMEFRLRHQDRYPDDERRLRPRSRW